MKLLSVGVALTSLSGALAQSQAPYPVVGTQSGVNQQTGQRPARININDLYQQQGPAWDIYIQALSQMQNSSESTETSYYQVMGIHGAPYIAWNGANQVSGGANSGYCPHGQLLFATWHRPFLAVYEQILSGIAQSIANQYTGSKAPQYKAAAASFRVPYWDWAASPALPQAVKQSTVTVNTPNGPSTIRNPLLSYQFQVFPFQRPEFQGQTLSQWSETKRCPDSQGNSNTATVDSSLGQSDLIDRVYRVFSTPQQFQNMSTTAYPGYSFEDPHNSVHTDIGCSAGHMYWLEWSAFDPIFMLHHCNVDRLIALWQAINYKQSMFTITGSEGGMFAVAQGPATANSPLKPFRKSDNSFHTSTSAANIRSFGYTYPEINDWSKTPAQLASDVTASVNTLYGGGAGSSRRSKQRSTSEQESDGPQERDTAKKTVYSLRISIDRSQVAVPAHIHITAQGKRLANKVLLSMPTDGVSHSTAPLENALKQFNLRYAAPETVVPFLQQNLRIEIRKPGGTTIDPSSVPSLQIELQAQEYEPRASDAEFPKYGTVQTWNMGTQAAATNGAAPSPTDDEGDSSSRRRSMRIARPRLP